MATSERNGMHPGEAGGAEDDRVTRLERLLEQAHERITQLEARLAAPPLLAAEAVAAEDAPATLADEPASPTTDAPVGAEKRGSRRALLKLGGSVAAASVAAAAVAASELAHPGVAHATTTAWQTQPFTADTETYVQSSGGYTGTTVLTVQDGTASVYSPLPASPNQAAIAGYQSAGGAGAFGVYGTATAGAGVGGAGNYGGAFAGVAAPLFLAPGVSIGAPGSGTHVKGEVYVDSAGVVWSCTNGGTPGTWVRLTGVKSGVPGGAFNFLPAPIRIFDTRVGQPAPLPALKMPLVGASTTTIQVTGTSVLGVSVPLGAAGFFGNLTVTNPPGPGDLILWPHGAAQPLSSNINFSTGQTVANAIIIGLDPNGQMDLYAHVNGGDVIVDVAGYIE
ncbi:MAG TPA: hypothetical protein VGR57_10210 [Ktedonobacterales bacterium]|nr:hypothetical protein [Ktedonobacterales bacterium]